MKIW
jgi:hypothetical protein